MPPAKREGEPLEPSKKTRSVKSYLSAGSPTIKDRVAHKRKHIQYRLDVQMGAKSY
ncbi:hypothetical protein IOK49_04225 [Fervidicoccus fontis]|uniref:Uncharacterized protein n=1 Tax=Fervidicoccus fontis TaxID=683846 RepID=A0A843A7J0_9CREN|nr:hypothetical protein [Fervidicoccus fontis]MBE9391278.1 hypothetical protein [Fervidicoccus fontis]